MSALSSLVLLATSAQGGTVPGGGNQAIDNNSPVEAWTLDPGSTLTSDGAVTLEINAQSATFIANGGSTQRLTGLANSMFNVTGTAINNSGTGAAVSTSSSTAIINASALTSDDMGLQIIRNNAGQNGSTVTLTNNSSVMALNGGALMTGFSQLNVINSSIEATDAASYGVRMSNADLNATGGTIVGGQNGLEVGREIALARTSTVTLDSSTIEGKSGSAIVVGFQDRAGVTANINVLNGSRLIGANGTILEVNDGAAVNFKADRSALLGDVIVESGSSAEVLLQNAASLNGNVHNVTQLILDASSLEGDVTADSASATSVLLKNGSLLTGNLQNVANLSLDGSSLTGNVQALPGAGTIVQLSNGSVLEGQIQDATTIDINSGAQWVMTGDNTVQQLALNNGVVRMGTNEQFLRLDVANLSGTSTVVMGTDLSTGNTDFLNVTGSASGQHLLRVSATGNDPINAEPVKIGNIASGDAAIGLEGGQVDAGTFTYKLYKEGEGLYLQTDEGTVSTSTDTALALAGSARSVMNAEMAMLSDQLGDRGMSTRPDASLRAMNDPSVKNLSNSVWVRTYGNQYSVDNAYGDGYTQNQTGISAGADTTVEWAGRSWVMGGFVGSSHTRMDLKFGSTATVESLNAGVYGSTFDDPSGVFVNVMAKVNQFDNKAKVTMSDGTRAKGDFKALGVSGSVAVGKHIGMRNNYFLQPQVGLATGYTQSDNYRLDNGLEVQSDAMRSLQGKVGIKGGREIALDNGGALEPSLFTAFNHEFVKANRVKINGNEFDDDRASSAVEYGAGVKWMPAQKDWQVSGQVGGSKGTTVSQDRSGSLRLSYFF